ncbi:MAG: hypothetical protein IPJ26_13445 [Bacteroidetes bacterium]|nr:hypothetical protein [Bacteroidota bacterium]
MIYLSYECHMILYKDLLKIFRRAFMVLSLMFAMLLSVAGSVFGQSPIASFSVPSAEDVFHLMFNLQIHQAMQLHISGILEMEILR